MQSNRASTLESSVGARFLFVRTTSRTALIPRVAAAFLAAAFLVGIVLSVIPAAAQSPISIQFDGGAFRVTGWQAAAPPSKGWSSIFTVYAGAGGVPAMVGNYMVEGGALVFRPTYPIAPGIHYRAEFHPPSGGAPIVKEFDGPPRPTNPIARVEHVYPSGDVWPSNQLRVFIYFSAPMSRDLAYNYIHMLDESGKELNGALRVFLPREELWDPTFRRLTMTFDPGRIKTGLTSNETIGMPIVEGKRYTLVIDKDWPDARGVPMVESFRKVFRGGPALRTSPDPAKFRVTSPKAGTLEALTVDFPTSMNYALLLRMMRVTGPQGDAQVAGTVGTALAETQWRFTPQQPWRAGSYRIIVDTGLEDIAGNSIERPFDLDTFKQVTEHIVTKTIPLPFVIR